MNKYHEVVYGNYIVSNYNEKLIDHLFPNAPKNLCVLEVGCGKGEILKILQERFTAEGIDHEIDLNTGTLPYFNDTFNVVFTKSTIEHIYNTEHFLAEIKRVLQPGGYVVILAPAWEYNYRWFYDDPTHVKPFHRKGLQDALRIAGFDLVLVDYFYHLPWYWGKHLFDYKWWLSPIVKLIRLLPDDWRWKDQKQQYMNVNIRFCKEVQLLGIGTK